MTHFGVIIGIISTILGILVIILGFLIKGVASFVRLVSKVESIEKSSMELTKKLTDVIIDVAVAKHSDMGLETRLQNLESSGRRR